MRPDELDALIDDVARTMTDAQPSSVRCRVKPRPTGTRVGRPFTGRLAWTAAAIAVLASAIVFMTREPRPADTPVARATPPAVATPAPPPRVAESPKPVTTRAPRAARPVTLAAVVAEPESGPPAPVVIAPVAFETVPAEPLAVELVETPMPLRAEWVQIELLNIQ